MEKELSPEAKEMLMKYVLQGARAMAGLAAENSFEGLKEEDKTQYVEHLMKKFEEKFNS